MADTIPGNTTSSRVLSADASSSSAIDSFANTDWWRTTPRLGYGYQVWGEGSQNGLGTPVDPYISVYDSARMLKLSNNDRGATITLAAAATYFLDATQFDAEALGSHSAREVLKPVAGSQVLGLSTTGTVSDITRPIPVGFSPVNGAQDAPIAGNIVITFDEAIQRGTGSISIRKADGTLVETFITSSSSRLSFFGITLTIDPTVNLIIGTVYQVAIDDTSVRDVAGNLYLGTSTYSFRTLIPFVVTGGLGNDSLLGSAGPDSISGMAGDDTIQGFAGDDTIDGGPGRDLVSFVAATAPVQVNLATGTSSGDGNDRLVSIEDVRGSEFSDILSGDSAANALFGGAGNDSIQGVDGNDTLNGGTGNDSLYGGKGSDQLSGGLGNDIIDGGDGVDVATYVAATASVNVDLTRGIATGGDGNDILTAIEDIYGSEYDDTLTGSDVANSINGGSGNDSLDGGKGSDQLSGGVGNDTIDGGDGNDSVYYTSTRSSISLAYNADTREFTITTPTEGVDVVKNVETFFFSF